jgi:hypothetical protein
MDLALKVDPKNFSKRFKQLEEVERTRDKLIGVWGGTPDR